MEVRDWEDVLESEVFTEEEILHHITSYVDYSIFCDEQGIDESDIIYTGYSVLEHWLVAISETISEYTRGFNGHDVRSVISEIADLIDNAGDIDPDSMYLRFGWDNYFVPVDYEIDSLVEDLIHELRNLGKIVDSIEADDTGEGEDCNNNNEEQDVELLVEITEESLMGLFTV